MSDLISRSAVIDVLQELVDMETCGNTVSDIGFGLSMAIGRLISAPAIDAVPMVHARWIYSGDMDLDGNSQGYCSRCGAGDKHRADLKNFVPYCWKCGARMDGEADV